MHVSCAISWSVACMAGCCTVLLVALITFAATPWSSKTQQQLTPAAGTCIDIVSEVFCLVAAYIFGFLVFVVFSSQEVIILHEETLVA